MDMETTIHPNGKQVRRIAPGLAKFNAWVKKHGHSRLARELDMTNGAIWSWRYGLTSPRVSHASKLLELAGGELTLQDIYPDKFQTTTTRSEA